jgi:hypothetical protein
LAHNHFLTCAIQWANIAFGEHALTARGVIMTDLAGSMGKLLAMWMDRDPQSRRHRQVI